MGKQVCPCTTDVENPGPHLTSCPWSDPEYEPAGLVVDKHPKDDFEYGRRNLLHAKAVGAHANARSAYLRLRRQKRAPKWLVKALEGIVERTKPLDAEMAAHRDEMW